MAAYLVFAITVIASATRPAAQVPGPSMADRSSRDSEGQHLDPLCLRSAPPVPVGS